MRQDEMTLAQYIVHRNGVPAGAPGSLRNMLERSFGAPTFGGFWQHWNPVFSYGLGRYIHSPLKRHIPPALALVLTFVVCGALHDGVTTLVRGSLAFLFTPWFFMLGVGVLLGRVAGINLAGRPWFFRAAVNLFYLLVCLALTLAALRLLAG